MSTINTEPSRFSELGYCLFPQVFSEAETAQNRRLLDEALASPLPLPPHWQRETGPDRPGYIGEPHVRDIRWLDLCRHPRLLDAVASILGPNLILVFSSVFVKLPHSPTKVGWHQDNAYWPSVHGTDVVTLWLAVDDADAANSAMSVIPGSHSGWQAMDTVEADGDEMLSRKVSVTAEQANSAVMLEMQAGSLSIHDSFLLHGSAGNGSHRRRAGYTIRYCSTDTAWVDMDTHPQPVFVVRGQAGSRGQGYTHLLPEIVATPQVLSGA
jgi:ectoine hydroxylase-related dioxygenase (phytanoyl-CoA dioxygenase family)